jgi:hypothetical protein
MRLKIRMVAGVGALAFAVGVAQPAEATSNVQPEATCGAASPISDTTTVAQGSTSAKVSLTVWSCDNGAGFYASANSTRDSNGFCFTGRVAVWVDVYPDFPNYVNARCGISDTPVVKSHNSDILVGGIYRTDNGEFCYLNGKHVAKTSFCVFDTSGENFDRC